MSRAVTMETLNSLGRVLATEFEEQLDLVCFPHKGRVGYLAKLGRVNRPELASDLILAHPAVRHACVCPQNTCVLTDPQARHAAATCGIKRHSLAKWGGEF